MNDILKKINELEKNRDIETYTEILEMLDKCLEEKLDKVVYKSLKDKRILINLELFKMELESIKEDDYKEIINKRGQLINLYKKAERELSSYEKKMEVKYKSIQELKTHKKIIKEYKTKSKDNISISEKVGLNILDISKSIEIFMKEKDVLTKVKNIGKETVIGSLSAAAIVGGIGLGLQYYMGLPLKLSTIVSALPVVAYVGLSSIIRNISSKTPFEQYQYQQSEEYKSLIEGYNKEHKEELEEFGLLLKEKADLDSEEDIIEMNEKIIAKLDELAKETSIDDIKKSYELQAFGLLKENKDYCEAIKDEYLDEKSDDKNRYEFYSKKLKKINVELYTRGNSFGEAVKMAGKSIYKNAKVLLIAKAILSAVFPNTFALNSVSSVLEPLAFAVINGIINIPTYCNKLKYKETDYEGRVKFKNKERIEEILGLKEPQRSFA